MKIIFLDRDGVINEFPGNGNYVTKLKDFHFIPGSLDAIRQLTEGGYSLFVISNQAGVGKGIYSQEKLNHITRKMLEEVKKAGGEIKKVLYCTHRSDEGCDCRKPGIGLMRKALDAIDPLINLEKKAHFIGDTEIDILAGHNAGCKTIFVLSGREDLSYVERWQVKPDFVAKDLLAAADEIINNNHSGK